jgi:integrase
MASVAKHPRSPFWYACYTDPTGRRMKKSTGLTARSKALEMARALQRAADDARRGALTEARARELLSEMLQSVNGGEGLRVFTVAQWLDLFVKGKRKSRSAATFLRHQQTMREFIEFLGRRADLNIAAITSKDVSDFRDRRQSRGLAPATLNLDVAILSSAFNAAWRQGLVSTNPALAVEPLKNKPQRKHVFSREQVSAIVKTATGDWKGLVLTAFYTGQRLGDCVSLRWQDVNLALKTIRFQSRKTGTEILAVIHSALEDFLLAIPTPETNDAFVFPTLAERGVNRLSNEFRKIMEAAHVDEGVIRSRAANSSGRSVHALSFHSLRHSFASILANAGIPEELRMTLIGHAGKAMHQRYSHHELERLRDAISVLPRL